MWKAEISKVEQDETYSVAKVTLVYTNGEKKETVTERVSDPNSISMIAQNAIKELNRIDAVKDLVANPPIGEIKLSVPSPTDAQLKFNKYQADKAILKQMKEDIDLGIISDTDEKYQNLLNLVKKEYSEINGA